MAKTAAANAEAGQAVLAIIRAALKLSFAENTLITATTLCRSPKKCAGLIPGFVLGPEVGQFKATSLELAHLWLNTTDFGKRLPKSGVHAFWHSGG